MLAIIYVLYTIPNQFHLTFYLALHRLNALKYTRISLFTYLFICSVRLLD